MFRVDQDCHTPMSFSNQHFSGHFKNKHGKTVAFSPAKKMGKSMPQTISNSSAELVWNLTDFWMIPGVQWGNQAAGGSGTPKMQVGSMAKSMMKKIECTHWKFFVFWGWDDSE